MISGSPHRSAQGGDCCVRPVKGSDRGPPGHLFQAHSRFKSAFLSPSRKAFGYINNTGKLYLK